MTTSNKILKEVSDIDEALQNAVGSLSMDNEEDRAKMSWWIHQTFCGVDYRGKIHQVTKSRAGNRTVQGTEPVSRKVNVNRQP